MVFNGKRFEPLYVDRGYEAYYVCKETHEILSERRKGFPKILKPVINGNGYYMVGLWKDGKQHNHNIHKILMDMFVPNPDLLPHINHIDGNKLNNDFHNLEWSTPSHNAQHAARVGLSNSKHCEKKVYQYELDGTFIQEFVSVAQAARATNMHSANIVCAAKGRTAHAGGYVWRYDKTDKLNISKPSVVSKYVVNDEEFRTLEGVLKLGLISKTTFYSKLKSKGNPFTFNGNTFSVVYI